ncbi:hypothetical protein FRUB_06181 [Fimbriiglobus ruber]|uniref:Uncharacterized protein n=1 Tax=Fimbriiglobus ruber TaxID=1908690 RepID=A0A225DPG9_9BACT|nr:hypothetical protein FRUB_06181 [Fimbriiglobus ruber]
MPVYNGVVQLPRGKLGRFLVELAGRPFHARFDLCAGRSRQG